ncbi:MAG: hypothetical protein ACRC3Y_03150 [Romboutsia sp.]|uniref:hypothetical protein n=1 Tax=Romboutsia sp. TaxID=1965302 RepID=UPI003F2E2634
MDKKDCNRKNILKKEFVNDWDELNIAFKLLLCIGLVLFIIVIAIAFFSNGEHGLKNSLEVVFRTTLASVFGFLLSSNIKYNNRKRQMEIEKIESELKNILAELDELDENNTIDKNACDLESLYYDKNINLVQIIIAFTVCIISIIILGILIVTNNLENVPSISQIRDLMCSSVGFLIGECGKK